MQTFSLMYSATIYEMHIIALHLPKLIFVDHGIIFCNGIIIIAHHVKVNSEIIS